MSNIPARVQKRFSENIRRFIKILTEAKSRDINESDTVKIVIDVLSDIFGYDKYIDITSEFQIRGTFCDVAIKAGDDVRYLIECKAIGSELKENHLRQAVEYASKSGIEWTILSNGIVWQVYKVVFAKPIDQRLLFSIDFLNEDPKDKKFAEKLYLLCKEAITKSAIESYAKERRAINKHTIAAILYSDEVVATVRRRLRSLFKDVSIDKVLVREVIRNEIIKRELVDSEQADQVRKMLRKGLTRQARKTRKAQSKDTGAATGPESADASEDASKSGQ